MAIGGIFGSALALLVVKEMDLNNVRWLVMVVVIYTGLSLLRTAAREKARGRTLAAAPGQRPSRLSRRARHARPITSIVFGVRS